MNNIAIFIPSRMGSTRLPNKPLAMIGDKPMILHVMDRAIEANLGPVYVACAEEEIANIVKNAGGNAVLTDPSHESGSDRIKEALDKVDHEAKIDLVINLQGDLPLINPDILVKAKEIMTNPEVDIGTFASFITDEEEIKNPNVVKIAASLDNNEDKARAIYFSRLPIPYNGDKFLHHIGVYVYRRSSLVKFTALKPSYLEKCEKLEQLRALEHGMRIDIAIVDQVPIGVDTKDDLEKVRNIYLS